MLTSFKANVLSYTVDSIPCFPFYPPYSNTFRIEIVANGKQFGYDYNVNNEMLVLDGFIDVLFDQFKAEFKKAMKKY